MNQAAKNDEQARHGVEPSDRATSATASSAADAAAPASAHTGFFRAFADLRRLPLAFWIIVGAFAIEAIPYFAILSLMQPYLSGDLGWGDVNASRTIAFFTASVTLFMLGAGSYGEKFGVRRAIATALFLCATGRLFYCWAPGFVGGGAVVAVLGGLFIVALGQGILQPVTYSGIKQYTDERTSSMGYALIYAIMNLAIVAAGPISSFVRPNVQRIIDARKAGEAAPPSILQPLANVTGSGIQAVNWVCVGLTVVTLILFVVLMTRRVERAKLRPDMVQEGRVRDPRPLLRRITAYFTEGPFTNTRFVFFIFILLPVRTLFAHQWLTMPEYLLRAFPKGVADNMEVIANSLNPAIIFIGVPLCTALTRRANVLTMILIGTSVSAVPTFLLSFGPNLPLLLTYIFVFSIGEALWSARFLEYASELAPEGQMAQYMGLANIPWLLAKFTTGLYSGNMLATFCPANTPPEQLRTGTMWFIYGCIALISPVGLFLARKWVLSGLHPRKPQVS